MRRILAVAVSVLFAVGGFAQDHRSGTGMAEASAAAPLSPSPDLPGVIPGTLEAPSAVKTRDEQEKQKLEQSYRVMGVVPMFSTTSRQDARPLTGAEKFHLFAKSATDPMAFVLVGMQARISQARNSFPAYGPNSRGYFAYYGAALADSVDSNFMSNYFYPVIFKQDPRYFRLGAGGFKRRAVHALLQEFKARKDSGGENFHYSNVLGALTAGGIANAYYPEANRGFGLTMSRAGIALTYGSLGGMMSEFWPDIQRKIFKDKQRAGLALPASSVPHPNSTDKATP